MNIILFDYNRENLFPLTYTRPVSYLRVGIYTIKEKWEFYFDNVYIKTEEYLSKKFPSNIGEENIWINASILPNDELVTEIKSLRKGESLMRGKEIVGFNNYEFNYSNLDKIETHANYNQINNCCDIFSLNGEEIKNDFKFFKAQSQSLSETNNVLGKFPIFIEKGASIEHSILNATEGPIYIGKDAVIMEGSMIRGPFALCNNAVVKMGAKVYGSTTIGPFSKIGGEVNNVVFLGYSSKAHDGFLGNSVIGEWCNLGADTNSSNLKNNYSEVKIWDYIDSKFQDTGLKFCGLIMGDHSKCGINTMFNTGTTVGICCNIFGSGFPRTFIPSFSWGGNAGFKTYKLNKVFEVAEIVMNRRSVSLDNSDKLILETLFEMTSKYRNY
tara:strand:+ start:1214 stop:2365 length:1152 start_codon:yes stop_codon:yes gene_type:complete